MRLPTMSAVFATVCLVALMSLAAAAPAMDPAAVQLSPSVLLMGYFDWKLFTGRDGRKWSRCLDMVWRARRLSTGNRLNMVPTHHWLPESDGFGVSAFCYMPSSGGCQPWTDAALAEFKQSMTLCFGEALHQGFVPYVRPHLDDGLNRGVWRNGLLFNPTLKYGGYSFADVMTTPLAGAMRDALAATAAAGNLTAPPDKARPTVYMGLQGEMSATLMRHTSAWASLVPAIKATIGSKHADVKVGVGLNFNALDAVEKHEPDAGPGGAGGLWGALAGSGSRGGLRVAAPPIDASGVRQLLGGGGVDFVGVSAYAPYSGAGFSANEFENSAFNVGDALRSLAGSLDLAALARSGALELHYSEFGIGGGVNGNGAVAPSADACARQPWAGVTGSYTPARDPWAGPPGARTTYAVREVFVWSMASWDLFGVCVDSSNGAGSFRDQATVARVARHNAAIIAAQVCARQGAAACTKATAAQAACLADDSGEACLLAAPEGATRRRRRRA